MVGGLSLSLDNKVEGLSLQALGLRYTLLSLGIFMFGFGVEGTMDEAVPFACMRSAVVSFTS